MKRLYSFTLSVFILFFGLSFSAQAARREDVRKIIEIMHSDSTKGILERKHYEEGGVRVVFVAEGKRYTFYHTGDGSINFLSVWVRPNGTADPKLVETFSDFNPDGNIDFAIAGQSGDSPLIRKPYDRNSPDNQNLTHWQNKYDKAINHGIKKLF